MSRSQYRVFIVEDDHDIQELLAELLTDEGFEVRSAQDGAAALAAMRDWVPDVVVTDLAMPMMDGARLIREMARNDALVRVPIIVASANGGMLGRVDDRRVTCVLSKPFDLDRLLASLYAALASDNGGSIAK